MPSGEAGRLGCEIYGQARSRFTDKESRGNSKMPADILIVDDSAAIRKILQRILKHAQLPVGNVFEAGDGFEALDVLRSNRIGLVLTDINMPNMDGLRLLGELRSNDSWKDLPVVVITTEGGEQKVMEAVKLGASAYLRKPFTPEQIKEKLERLVPAA
jgi:two-component system chemotaxis response regulator CheY